MGLVARRVRVTLKRSGSGGVSAMITIPQEVYEALGAPEEVLVDYSEEHGAMLVRPARALKVEQGKVRLLEEVAREAEAVEARRVAASEAVELLARLDWEPRVILLDCGKGILYARTGDKKARFDFHPSQAACQELAAELAARILATPPLPKARRYLIEVFKTKAIVYTVNV